MTGDNVLPEGLIDKSRQANYQNVVNVGRPLTSASLALSLFGLVSFLSTPWGMWFLLFGVGFCSGFVSQAQVLAAPWTWFAVSGVITSVWSIGTFIPFARLWDHYYASNPGLRNQPKKTHSVQGFNRSEVRLATLNLFIAAMITSAVGVTHVTRGWDSIYMDASERGVGYLLLSTVAYFLWIDAWAYVSHRVMHFPPVYRRFHKWHHEHVQCTAFSSLALHPVDMISFQGGVYTGLYLFPLHPAAIVVNLVYIHYFNVVDHSGIFAESWIPWQPSTLYHDDHHKLFHVNYGQTLPIFDQVFGTFYSDKKTYGEKVFSDKIGLQK